MDYFVEYCDKVYVDESTFYVNKIIKNFKDNGYDKDLTTAKSLPLKQYAIYKIYKVGVLEYNMKNYNIKSVENFRYEYSPFDNNLTPYLKRLYEDNYENEKKLKDYVKSRKYLINKKIVAGDRSPLIASFLEYDKMCMIVRDIRLGVVK